MLATVNETLSGKETSTIHRFERAGLGVYPFHFTGMTESVITYPDGTSKAGSSCDYCSTGIRYQFWCESSDGKRFKVGCDCIHKSGDAGLIKQISLAERKLRDAKNVIARAKRAEKLSRRIIAAKAKLPSVCGTLSDKPHPNQYMADKGLTMLDYVNWCFDNCQDKACHIVERA